MTQKSTKNVGNKKMFFFPDGAQKKMKIEVFGLKLNFQGLKKSFPAHTSIVFLIVRFTLF